jgi:fructokinase
MKNNKYDNILCFGEILWDMLPTGAQPGGAPVNVAIHLKKQGQNPVIVSKTGNDKEGSLI